MYLYLMDNMFDVNIRWDQQGPVRFTWSIRSHEGGWQEGKADQFGWDVLNPLIAKVVTGKKKGTLPAASSFVRIDQPNVVCSTIKPAEANGAGFIARFNETQGTATTATVALPFHRAESLPLRRPISWKTIAPTRLPVKNGNEVTFTLRPFGVKTIRAGRRAEAPPACPLRHSRSAPRSDMQVELSWPVDPRAAKRISHYNVYRGSQPDFQPSLLNLVARPASASLVDQPQLHYGGWINNRLEPGTTSYYRVAAVDRWNNEGPLINATRRHHAQIGPEEHGAAARGVPARHPGQPHQPAELREPAVPHELRIGRAAVRNPPLHQGGFEPDASTRIGVADADAVVKASTGLWPCADGPPRGGLRPHHVPG